MRELVRQNILKVKQYIPGKPIEEVKRELGLKEVVKLASNENCLGPSPKALSAIRKALKDINRYPDSSSFYLREKLSEYLGVAEPEMIFGNGSDEVIGLAIRTFVGSGDEVIIAQPTFLMYEIFCQLAGAKMVRVPLGKDLRYDLKAMKSAITSDTKMVFIANPDNPTGTYVTREELDEFFDSLPEGVIVFIDEAYFEFAHSIYKDYPDGLDYLKKPGVIVGRSFSKAYGLAGLRIGYGVACAEMIGYMERSREPFNVNLLAQAGATAALDDKAFLKDTLAHVKKEKEFLYAGFRRIGIRYHESATNFVMADVARDCKRVFEALLRKGVIVRDMKAWGLDTYIRVTVGKRPENTKFLEALDNVLKKYDGR